MAKHTRPIRASGAHAATTPTRPKAIRPQPDAHETSPCSRAFSSASLMHLCSGKRCNLAPALTLRNVEDLLAERGIDISHETVRFWWNRFGPMFAAEIRKRRVAHMRGYPQWRWHLDEVFVKVNGKLCYLWRAVDHEARSWKQWLP